MIKTSPWIKQVACTYLLLLPKRLPRKISQHSAGHSELPLNCTTGGGSQWHSNGSTSLLRKVECAIGEVWLCCQMQSKLLFPRTSLIDAKRKQCSKGCMALGERERQLPIPCVR